MGAARWRVGQGARPHADSHVMRALARNMHAFLRELDEHLTIPGAGMSHADVESARTEVLRSRAKVADTLATLRDRVTEPVAAVRRRLDVADAIQQHPWSALAVAVGAGVLVAATGAEARAASAAAEAARQGRDGAARLAQQAGHVAAEAARQAPSRTREVFVTAAEALVTRLAFSLYASLREDDTPPRSHSEEHPGFV